MPWLAPVTKTTLPSKMTGAPFVVQHYSWADCPAWSGPRRRNELLDHPDASQAAQRSAPQESNSRSARSTHNPHNRCCVLASFRFPQSQGIQRSDRPSTAS